MLLWTDHAANDHRITRPLFSSHRIEAEFAHCADDCSNTGQVLRQLSALRLPEESRCDLIYDHLSCEDAAAVITELVKQRALRGGKTRLRACIGECGLRFCDELPDHVSLFLGAYKKPLASLCFSRERVLAVFNMAISGGLMIRGEIPYMVSRLHSFFLPAGLQQADRLVQSEHLLEMPYVLGLRMEQGGAAARVVLQNARDDVPRHAVVFLRGQRLPTSQFLDLDTGQCVLKELFENGLLSADERDRLTVRLALIGLPLHAEEASEAAECPFDEGTDAHASSPILFGSPKPKGGSKFKN